MKIITHSDINAVKRAAKAARKTGSSLSYMQWLDHFARQNHQVSGFHELQKICDNGLLMSDDIQELSGGIVHCRFCGCNFVAQLDCDRAEHKKRHRQCEQFLSAMGYLPQQHDRRETTKRQGYMLMSSADTEQQRTGALAVLAGHFDRSLSAAIDGDYWRGHPDFDEYIAMALPNAGFTPAHIKSRLAAEFGEYPSFFNDSYWKPGRGKVARSAPPKDRNGTRKKLFMTLDLSQ
ncbi:hypothetical protein [Trabulsiella odontotermitis]|uniref:hypothetical protein n=1 Tax=Trabulsiella odontotermitis TaxID=379893 RepID=UPI000675C827|nr:hypothetical protein [Trabulsiella odontotermitis]KNC92573.1 hypothetical protein GM30_15855 [Trabulsiella odontotermitis]